MSIPQNDFFEVAKNDYVTDDIMPSKTLNENDILSIIDGLDALKQTITRIITTERFQHSIYDHRYGIELNDLIGADIDYAMLDIERRVKEALFEDDRIIDILDFSANITDDIMHIEFKIDTIFGIERMEVNL